MCAKSHDDSAILDCVLIFGQHLGDGLAVLVQEFVSQAVNCGRAFVHFPVIRPNIERNFPFGRQIFIKKNHGEFGEARLALGVGGNWLAIVAFVSRES